MIYCALLPFDLWKCQMLACYWLLSTVFGTIKAVRLNILQVLHPTTTKTSKYPSADQFLDVVVMVRVSNTHHSRI